MSLLMDALKKAEAAKRLAAGQSETPASESEAAPETRPPEPEHPTPELPPRLELLDEQFSKPPRPATREAASASAQAAANERDRIAAHNLFVAKRPESRAPFWIGLTLCTLAAVTAIGTWFWWQLRPLQGGLRSGPALAQSGVRSAPALPAAPAQPPQPPQATQEAPIGTPPPASTSSPPARQPETPSSASTIRPPQKQRMAPLIGADPTRAGTLTEPAPVPAAEDNEPRLRRSPPQHDQIYPAVARGYAAFMNGDYAAARREYDAALRADPRSIDALNGMAATARRSGLVEQAEAYWTRALEVDPKDATAQAGMLALRGPGDPVSTETRLKSIVTAQPDAGSAHFALGNLYARENRWQEAQQAYFRAYTSDPENPDYLFNLAVSLDQLRQPRLALQYYQNALSAAEHHPIAFDREQVVTRVRVLQSAP